MKSVIMLLTCALLLFTGMTTVQFEKTKASIDTLRTGSEVEANKYSYAVILGKLQKFTPWTEGKGRNVMYWDWEIVLPKGGSFPVTLHNKSDGESINFVEYEGEYVKLYAYVYYGIVIGDSNPDHQSATGYRLDAIGIEIWEGAAEQILLPDTCWIYRDIEENPNKEIIAAGKLIEYIPSHDNSKLGSEKIWDWELQMQDGYTIPIGKTNSSLDLSKFKNKDVFIKAFLKFGIIFGDTNTANMEGYRIDPLEVYLNERGYGSLLDERKINFSLSEFTDNGMRRQALGEGMAINYEFCIPGDDKTMKEVMAIDPTAKIHKDSKGRSACSEREWLVIGASHQDNFKEVIKKLAALEYVRQINETFWE